MFISVVILYCYMLGLNIWFFLIRPSRPWSAKLGTVLQIVAVYAFALTVVAKTGILPADLAAAMTSTNLFGFLQGHTAAIGVGFQAASLALHPEKMFLTAFTSVELLFGIALAIPALIYGFFHLLVVVPVSYVANVIVSLPVSAIVTSSKHATVSFGAESISIQEVIAKNGVEVKNLLISFSSLVLKTTLDLGASYRSTAATAGQPARAGWLTRHPRLGRWVLAGIEIDLGILLFVCLVNAMAFPWLGSSGSASVAVEGGEIVGAEIVLALFAAGLVALFVKVRQRRRRVGRPAAAAGAAATSGLEEQTGAAGILAGARLWVASRMSPAAWRRARWALIVGVPAVPVLMIVSVQLTERASLQRCMANEPSGCARACEDGSAPSCERLAQFHETGQGGLAKNPARAAALYQQACGGGVATACNTVVKMVLSGRGGVVLGAGGAVGFYQRVCAEGADDACYLLGSMYLTGLGGLEKDSELAAAMFRHACDRGVQESCEAFDDLSRSGQGGLIVGMMRAVAVFKKACEGGNSVSCAFLKRLQP